MKGFTPNRKDVVSTGARKYVAVIVALTAVGLFVVSSAGAPLAGKKPATPPKPVPTALIPAGFGPVAAAAPAPAAVPAAVDLVATRSAGCAQLFSGTLDAKTATKLRGQLAKLADQTIFGPKVFDGDPYTARYTIAAGDTADGVVRKLHLHIPSALLLKINGIGEGGWSVGQEIKVIKGPFRVEVHKNTFALDLYLENAGGAKTFVKRLGVGLGKADGTPEGAFVVRAKSQHTTWYPPPSMADKIDHPVQWGQKGYPLGKEGYWIGLKGTDAATSGRSGYGIHGTNAQWSIGQARSHGCVRMADAGIATVFSLLVENASTVRIMP
jgi:lipoprotein-anchoring transpeptidase ErfK/SrfK